MNLAALGIHLFDLDLYTFSPYAAAPFLTAIAIFFLGLYVLFKEENSRVGGSFFFFSFLAAFWLFCFSWMYCSLSEQTALSWAKTAYWAVPLIPFAIYFFTVHFLQLYQRHRQWLILSGIVSSSFVLLIMTTNGFIRGVYHYSWGYYPKYGVVSIPFILFFFILAIQSMRLYWTAYQNAGSEPQKKRIHTLLTGFAIAYLASFDYLAKFGIPLYPFGYIPILVFLILAAKAVGQYRFTDLSESERMAHEISRNNGYWIVLALIVLGSIAGLSFYIFRTASFLILNLAEGRHAAGVVVERLGIHIAAASTVVGFIFFFTLVVMAKLGERHRRMNQLFASVVESSDDAILTKTLEGIIVSWNKGAERLYGYSAKEIINKNIAILMPPKELKELPKILDRLKKGEKIIQYETVRCGKSGRVFYVALTISPIRDARGKITGAVSIAKDITLRKQVEQDLIQKNKELERTAQELKERTENLQRFHNLTVGRELEMRRIKSEIDGLLQQLGHEKKYKAGDSEES